MRASRLDSRVFTHKMLRECVVLKRNLKQMVIYWPQRTGTYSPGYSWGRKERNVCPFIFRKVSLTLRKQQSVKSSRKMTFIYKNQCVHLHVVLTFVSELLTKKHPILSLLSIIIRLWSWSPRYLTFWQHLCCPRTLLAGSTCLIESKHHKWPDFSAFSFHLSRVIYSRGVWPGFGCN